MEQIIEPIEIAFNEITCSYGSDGRKDLRPFDNPVKFSIKSRETWVLTGDNATGKTSFLHTIIDFNWLSRLLQ